MAQYTVKDTQTGKTVTFQWDGEAPPTDADMSDVFKAARGQSQPQRDAFSYTPAETDKMRQAFIASQSANARPIASHTPGAQVISPKQQTYIQRVLDPENLRDYLQTQPATGAADWATRVVPESIGKLPLRLATGAYQAIKGQTDPLINSATQGMNPVPEMLSNAYKSAVGAGAGTLQGLGFGQTPEGNANWSLGNAKNAWITDPAGSALGIAALGTGLKSVKGDIQSALTPSNAALASKLDNTIKTGIEKGIRPGIEGNRTFGQSQNYMQKAQNAVETIIDNKDSLNLTNEYNEPVQGLPTNLKQFSQAIDQTKQNIFDQYNGMATAAGGSGVEVPLTSVIPELDKIANNRVLQDMAPGTHMAPGPADYAKSRAEALNARGTYTAPEAQEAIAILNKSLESFYKNPSYDTASKAYIDSLVVNHLRKSLDDVIENTNGPGYQELKNQYGALKTIEKDVSRRAVVDARKNNKGLLDFSDVFSGSEVVRGILTMNPATVGTGVAAKMIANLYKLKNDPNRIVKGMFGKANSIIRKQQGNANPQ